MAKYNAYMNSHFSGCRLLAHAHDNCRNRDVSLFEIPGNIEHVGVSDGTDAWIAPVIAEPFSVNCRKLLDALHHGTLEIVPRERPTAARPRRTIPVAAPTTPVRTRRVIPS